MKAINKITYIICISLVLPLAFLSCSKHEIGENKIDGFIKFYGNSFSDAGNDVIQLSDGKFAIVGTSTNVKNGLPQDQDIVVLITDDNGNEIDNSPFKFGGKFNDQGYAVILSDDSHLVIAGTISDSSSFGITQNAYVIKSDLNGDTLWTASIGSDEFNEKAMSVAQANDGGYIIAGETETAANDKQILLIKLSGEGNLEWKKEIGGNREEQFGEMILSAQGNYLIGTSFSNVANQQRAYAYLIKFNGSGNASGAAYFGSEAQTYGESIKVMEDGTLLIAGTSEKSNGDASIFYAMADAGLQEIAVENNVLGNSGDYLCKSVIYNGSELIFVSTITQSLNQDMCMIFTDLEGNVLDEVLMGGQGDQTAAKGIRLSDGFLLVGTNIMDGDGLVTLVKTNLDGKILYKEL